jgi:hypothetical protein
MENRLKGVWAFSPLTGVYIKNKGDVRYENENCAKNRKEGKFARKARPDEKEVDPGTETGQEWAPLFQGETVLWERRVSQIILIDLPDKAGSIGSAFLLPPLTGVYIIKMNKEVPDHETLGNVLPIMEKVRWFPDWRNKAIAVEGQVPAGWWLHYQLLRQRLR